MTALPRNKTLGNTLFLVLLFALSPLVAKSQQPTGTWIEIHVNGPWDYVPYTDSAAGYKQIVLIVPYTMGHDKPVYLSGPHADQAADQRKDTKLSHAKLNILVVDGIQNGVNCPGRSPTSNSKPFTNLPLIKDKRIADVIEGSAKDSRGKPLIRYAIVLPKPCYTTSDPKYDSYSDMDKQQVYGKNPKPYTIWMTLHYYVNLASVTATYNGIQVKFDAEKGAAPAFSFVMRGKKENETCCDAESLMSVTASAALWGITGHLFAQFPQIKNDAQTTTYSCNSKCRLSKEGVMDSTLSTPPLHTVGSGDCHRAQIVIKSALP